MKIPRNITGTELINLLKQYGYYTIRQRGSHIRLQKDKEPIHSITIPNHNPIKIGTLSNILMEVAIHLEKTKDQLINELFGE